jgi:hypothetical protein
MRFALIAAMLAGPCAAAPALTAIQDTLYKADGTRFNGVAQIEWKSFQAADGSEVPQQMLTVKIVSGQLRVSLVPNLNASRPTTYTVKFNSDGRTQFVEYWVVPESTTPLRLQNVRTTPQIGAITDISPTTISHVVGLQSELEVRPAKGDGFAPARAAVINPSGALDAALGNPEDCVRVDGTSGPCGGSGGGPVYIDGETPAGAIDGVNKQFTIQSAPSPVASLHLFRNGMLLRQGFGYTISGSVITMNDESTPVPGDELQAWYRLPGTNSDPAPIHDNATPAGFVDGSNPVFSLETMPSPASSLQVFRNGLLMKAGVDYVLTGSSVTFLPGAIPQPGDILQTTYRY